MSSRKRSNKKKKGGGRTTCKILHLRDGSTVRRKVRILPSGRWRFVAGRC